MCTWLTKVRGDTVLKLEGIHCCMSVEVVQEVAPDISRANGWQEVFVEQQFPGKTVVWVPLGDEAVCRLNNIKPAGVLEYRGQTIHFISRDRIEATRAYIAAKLRRAEDFPRHQRFLENLPAEFLKASTRSRVVGLLDRVLAKVESA
jgi:hypothetical protein